MKFQIKKFRNLSFLFLALSCFFLTSCNKSDLTTVDVESFADSSITDLQQGALGKGNCLELVFPVTIQFVDGTTASATDYKNLHIIIKEFFEANDLEKNKANKPSFVFPIQVLNQKGEIVDVESGEALLKLRKLCSRIKHHKGHKGLGFKCFSLVFPLTIFIDGEEQSFDNAKSMKAAIRAYKKEAGKDATRPQLVFPITVEYDDESQVEVASKDELKALKEACN